jgi:hypothetical protein
MKRYLLSLLLLAFVMPAIRADEDTSGADSCDTENTSKSYLFVNPHFHSASPEMEEGFRSARTHARECGWHGAFQAVVFGSRSTHANNTARYFFPFGKTSLLVSEDIVIPANLTPTTKVDLFAEHFGIFSPLQSAPFSSRISIKPRQTVVGVGLHYRQSLWRDEDKGRGFWFDISAPVTHIKNELNLTEAITQQITLDPRLAALNPPIVGFTNMTDALKQTGWNFGKIDDEAKAMKRTGLADLEIKIGYEWLDYANYETTCHLESYLGVLAPTGNKPKGEYLFEAVLGYGKHVGVMWGNNLGIELWRDDCNERSLRVEVATNSKYLFRKEQIRSLDLKYKPWSRYIQLYANQAAALAAQTEGGLGGQIRFTPGINILTQEVDVTPGFMYDMNCGWVFNARNFSFELGYNFFARRSDCVELDSFNATPAIKALLGLGQTNPIRDITGNFFLETATGTILGTLPVTPANFSQSVITLNDLDLNSAAVPAMLVHTVYGALGYTWGCEYPVFFDLGASYTFSNSNNAVMDRWTVWAKIGVSL